MPQTKCCLLCIDGVAVAWQVMAEVRGGKPVKLLIKGEAVLPAVDIKEAQLDLGEVYTGVTARIPITIINTTPVLAGQSLVTPTTCISHTNAVFGTMLRLQCSALVDSPQLHRMLRCSDVGNT